MTNISVLDAPAPFDVWEIDLGSAPGDAELAVLSRDECERASRFVFARDRRRFLAAHVALRHLLARRADAPAAQLCFAAGPFGKPRLSEASRDCSFNLSHSEDIALVALAPDGEVGVDVEMLRTMDDAPALSERNFTARECAELAEVAIDARAHAFLRCWTRKEACLKAIGSGLSIAPETFEAGVGTDTRLVRIATPKGEARVEVHSLTPRAGWIGAVARVRRP